MKSRDKPRRAPQKACVCPRCQGPMAKGKARCQTCKRKRKAFKVAVLMGTTVPDDSQTGFKG